MVETNKLLKLKVNTNINMFFFIFAVFLVKQYLIFKEKLP